MRMLISQQLKAKRKNYKQKSVANLSYPVVTPAYSSSWSFTDHCINVTGLKSNGKKYGTLVNKKYLPEHYASFLSSASRSLCCVLSDFLQYTHLLTELPGLCSDSQKVGSALLVRSGWDNGALLGSFFLQNSIQTKWPYSSRFFSRLASGQSSVKSVIFFS